MTTKIFDRVSLLFLLPVLLSAAPRRAPAVPPSSFHVAGAVVNPKTWTAELAKGLIDNHRLPSVVPAQGFDGHTVDFSMAKLLPPDSEPVQLIVLDDGKRGRLVHNVAIGEARATSAHGN